MKIGDLIPLDDRKSSGWVDSCNAYLYLKKSSDGFELSIRSNDLRFISELQSIIQ